MKIINQSVELISYTPNPEQVIEIAGRTCYKSEDKITDTSASRFVKNIVKSRGHESISEHASATFKIITDRAVSHQIVRHRLASYSQESQRYCNYTKDSNGGEIVFIDPIGLSTKNRSMFLSQLAKTELLYKELIANGEKAEVARGILPNATKTEIIVTMNFRSWMHFINLRKDKHAQQPIREIANLIEEQLAIVSPSLFDYSLENL